MIHCESLSVFEPDEDVEQGHIFLQDNSWSFGVCYIYSVSSACPKVSFFSILPVHSSPSSIFIYGFLPVAECFVQTPRCILRHLYICKNRASQLTWWGGFINSTVLCTDPG